MATEGGEKGKGGCRLAHTTGRKENIMTSKFKRCQLCELEWVNDMEDGPSHDVDGWPIYDMQYKCNACDRRFDYTYER